MSTRTPPAAQHARRDEPVTAVVALAADDDDPPAVDPSGRLPHPPGHGAAGPVHQHLDRRAGFDRAPIRLAHLHRGEQRLHASATATAIAMLSVCVSVRSHRPTPRSPAISAARRCSDELGLPARELAHLHVTHRELPQPDPHGLHHRFLRREPGRERRHRLAVTERVLALTLAEQPLGDARPAGECEPEPLALDQVGPDPQHEPRRWRRPADGGVGVTPRRASGRRAR